MEVVILANLLVKHALILHNAKVVFLIYFSHMDFAWLVIKLIASNVWPINAIIASKNIICKILAAGTVWVTVKSAKIQLIVQPVVHHFTVHHIFLVALVDRIVKVARQVLTVPFVTFLKHPESLFIKIAAITAMY